MKNYIFATLLLFTCIIADASVIGRHLYRDSHTGINTSSFGSSLSNLCSATQTIDSSSCVIEQKSCKPEGSWVSGTYFGYGLYGDSVPVKITYSKQCGETVYPDVIHQKNVSRAELPEPEPDQCQFSPISANPVRISNGSKKYVESDYLSTKEYPVEFRRKYWGKYASVAEHNVGKWHFSHSFSLAHDSTNGIVRLARPNGQFLKFTINDETWSPENKSVKGNLVATEAGWIYTRPEGVEEHYGTDGKINKIRYRSGAETTYTHTEQPFNAGLTYKGDKSVDHGYLVPEKTEITDPYGDTYQVLYNSLGNVSEFVAADGRRWQYSYSTNNPFLLEKVIYPDGTSQQYLYDAEENIIGIVDENGEQVTEVRYDNSGRVTYSALADGVESSSFTYHLNKTEVVNSLGHKTVYHFEDVPSTVGSGKRLTKIEGEDQSSCLQNVKSQTYDSNGYIQTKTTADKGVVETIKDSNGNTTVERTGLKWSSSNTLEEIPGTSKKTEISWHQEFNKPIEQKFYELDKAGVWSHKLTITYIYYDGVDESAQYGKLKQLSKLDVSTGEQRTWQYSYQIDNVSGLTQRKVETDSLNNSTEWIYDHKGRVIEVKNALQHSTIFEYSGINNKPIKVTNVNGSITQLSWDLRGRLVQIQQGSLIQSFEYFANGKVKSITSPSGQKLTYGYDTPGRLTSISDELGNKIEYDYDTESNLVQSRVIDASQSVQFTKSNVYNKLSQLVKLLDHSGNFKQQEFNHVDQLQKIIDGEGNETTFEYDAIGRLLKEVNAEGNPVSYEYDFRDKISSITDQENRTTT